jgi:hypothetical protein
MTSSSLFVLRRKDKKYFVLDSIVNTLGAGVDNIGPASHLRGSQTVFHECFSRVNSIDQVSAAQNVQNKY